MRCRARCGLLLLFVGLCGCRVYVPNDQIIRDTKACLDAGMAVAQSESGHILCVPRKEQKP